MAVLEDDFSVDGTLAADVDPPICSPPVATQTGDWQSLYERAQARVERERTRANEAEARAEELRWAEVAARSDAGSWKARFQACRGKLTAAGEEIEELRRAARDALPLLGEVERLTKLLSDAGIETGRGGMVALQPEAAQDSKARNVAPRSRYRDAERLSKALETVRTQKDTIKELRHQVRALRKTSKEAEARKDTIARLRHQIGDLRKAVKEAETRKSAVRGLTGMIECLRERLRDFQDQRDTIRVLNWRVDTLRLDLDGLRASLEKSEEEKKGLVAEMAELRATGSVLSRRLYGRKSEQQKKPGTGRKRGQQRGAPGHGHTQGPRLEERPEQLNPPPEACVCVCCGQPYAPNGAEQSTLVEIEVKAHKRVIQRPRLRRTCACASSPMEVSAPPVPRLFVNTMHPHALPALLDGAEAHRNKVRIDHRTRAPIPASARNETARPGGRFRDAWSAAGSSSAPGRPTRAGRRPRNGRRWPAASRSGGRASQRSAPGDPSPRACPSRRG